ncbi:MAG: pyruvate kinase [Anaerobutyricum sp.]
MELSIPFMSEKDKEDLLFGIKQDVDFVAASFTRTADDIKEMKAFLKANGGEDIRIIAKIENSQGVDNIDSIIDACEGIMVARGDMGVEIPEEEVPIIQKMIIKKVIAAGKVVITATQMLDSMMKNPRPYSCRDYRRCQNAIYDGTSAIMLSGETAAGAYPVEAVKMMAKIAKRTEEAINYRKRFDDMAKYTNPGITDAICHATCSTAYDLDAKAIITVTKTGFSARMIAKYRPGCDVIGCAMDEKARRQLNLSWGVRPILLGERNGKYSYSLNVQLMQCKKKVSLENRRHLPLLLPVYQSDALEQQIC